MLFCFMPLILYNHNKPSFVQISIYATPHKIKQALRKEGLLNFYVVTYITLQTFLRNVSLCVLYVSSFSCYRKTNMLNAFGQFYFWALPRNETTVKLLSVLLLMITFLSKVPVSAGLK